MSPLAPAPGMLSLLYVQHRSYTAELGRTHHVLSKLYKKVAKAERVLAERERKVRVLTRDERKKLQWTRVQTKRTIKNMELQQINLHDALRQSTDLISSLECVAYNPPAMTPWTGDCTFPSPCWRISPLSPVFTPNAPPVVQHGPGAIQYWDLSGLPERQASLSPYGSRSTDSGFHEPEMLGLNAATEADRLVNAQHVYAREMMSRFSFTANSTLTATARDDNTQTDPVERDVVPDLEDVVSPLTRIRAPDASARPHKRCVSASAIQSNPGTLAPPTTKRGLSAGPVPDRMHQTLARGLDGNQN